MEKLNYAKPKLEFVSLHNQEVVAAKCWGWHDTDHINEQPWYLDSAEGGFLQFTVKVSDSCALSDNMVIYYYEGRGDKHPDEVTMASDPVRYQEYLTAIGKTGGNSGQPFDESKGSGIKPTPDPGWSWT